MILAEGDKAQSSALLSVQVRSRSGELVPLAAIADVWEADWMGAAYSVGVFIESEPAKPALWPLEAAWMAHAAMSYSGQHRFAEKLARGDDGFSAKSASGEGSMYFSLVDLKIEGTVTLVGETLTVAGTGWFDREWSSQFLKAGQQGWDWFALHPDIPAIGR